MIRIIVEGLLLLALVAAAVTLVYHVIVRLRALGPRLAQAPNREPIDRVCPVHGPHEAHELVRLPNGERICPRCYAEALRAE